MRRPGADASGLSLLDVTERGFIVTGSEKAGNLPDEPTEAEWKRLYDAALAFRDTAPWTWMTEERVFGIQDPEAGETYYACIMGELGEHLALALYEGGAGLAGLWQMRLDPPEHPMEALLLQRCLMASFEDREGLEQQDRDVLKRLGLKVRGRGAWPLFRSYLPGYAPWFITGAQARSLTTGLEQALLASQRSKTEPDYVPLPQTPAGPYLVRVPSETEGWKEEMRSAEAPTAESLTAAVLVDVERVHRLKDTLPKTQGVVEMDGFVSPAGVRGGDGGRPYFPTVILSVDQKSGMVLGSYLSEPGAISQNFGEQFLEIAENLQMLPARVHVVSEEVQAFLEPFAGPLGVQVRRVRRLKMLDEARDSLSMFLGGGGLGLDPMELLGELGEMLSETEDFAPPPPRRLRRTPSSRG
jgi:hypothetical protein